MQHRSQYNIPQLVVTQNMMMNSARGCVRTMEILNAEQVENFSEWHMPFYMLAVTALELFPKIILSRRFEDGVHVSVIEKQFRKYGHELDKIYSKKAMGEDFLRQTRIEAVDKVSDPDQFVHRFDFKIKDLEHPIQVYHTESLRYGLMSGERSNAAYVAYQTDGLLDLCKRVQDATFVGASIIS